MDHVEHKSVVPNVPLPFCKLDVILNWIFHFNHVQDFSPILISQMTGNGQELALQLKRVYRINHYKRQGQLQY